MTEFKGTPGPWRNSSGEWVTDSKDDIAVAKITRYNCDASVQQFNAQLIAAAPELLEALQNMMGAFDNPIACRKLPADFNKEAILSARAAIAKALGETS